MKDIYRMDYYELLKYYNELTAEQCFEMFDRLRACNFGINIDIELIKTKFNGLDHFCVTMIIDKYRFTYEKQQKSVYLYLPFQVMRTMVQICDENLIKYKVMVSDEYEGGSNGK